jgi:hypothetical protein
MKCLQTCGIKSSVSGALSPYICFSIFLKTKATKSGFGLKPDRVFQFIHGLKPVAIQFETRGNSG